MRRKEKEEGEEKERKKEIEEKCKGKRGLKIAFCSEK